MQGGILGDQGMEIQQSEESEISIPRVADMFSSETEQMVSMTILEKNLEFPKAC